MTAIGALFLLLLLQSVSPVEDLSAARSVAIGATPDQRVNVAPEVAPGAPPVLSFRYYEGQTHHRYSNSDLMLDDAGH